MSHQRPDWDEFWINKLEGFGERATCDRGRSAAILVDPKMQRLISTGYVGAPRGLKHCDDVGHLLRKVLYEDGSTHEHCVRTSHAERNAIVLAARAGVAVDGATLYCNMEPCVYCACDIINAGVLRVVAKHLYHGAELTREWFRDATVELVVLNGTHAIYGPDAGKTST